MFQEPRSWRLKYSANTDDGRISYYNCKVNRNCPLKIYLLFENRNQDVHLYKTEAVHNHALKQVGLFDSVKQQIDELLTLGVNKPSGIIRAFREKNMPEPARRQLSSYLSKTRAKQGNSHVSIFSIS